MAKRIIRIIQKIALGSALMFVASCSTPKNVTYFQDITDTIIPVTAESAVRIEPGNRLSIMVKSKDPVLADLFNLTVNTSRLGNSSTTPEGLASYIVSKNGTIDMPVLGEVKVAGMTRGELVEYISGALRAGHVRDAVVTVELLNATFSAMGEVNRPGRHGISKDKMTILEAIAVVGDLGIQGKRENVTLVRTEGDTVRTYKLDLTNMAELAKSPAYYIHQDDVIYVEPNDVRKRQTTVNGNNLMSWGFWVSVASLLTSIAVLIVK